MFRSTSSRTSRRSRRPKSCALLRPSPTVARRRHGPFPRTGAGLASNLRRKKGWCRVGSVRACTPCPRRPRRGRGVLRRPRHAHEGGRRRRGSRSLRRVGVSLHKAQVGALQFGRGGGVHYKLAAVAGSVHTRLRRPARSGPSPGQPRRSGATRSAGKARARAPRFGPTPCSRPAQQGSARIGRETAGLREPRTSY